MEGLVSNVGLGCKPQNLPRVSQSLYCFESETRWPVPSLCPHSLSEERRSIAVESYAMQGLQDTPLGTANVPRGCTSILSLDNDSMEQALVPSEHPLRASLGLEGVGPKKQLSRTQQRRISRDERLCCVVENHSPYTSASSIVAPGSATGYF